MARINLKFNSNEELLNRSLKILGITNILQTTVTQCTIVIIPYLEHNKTTVH